MKVMKVLKPSYFYSTSTHNSLKTQGYIGLIVRRYTAVIIIIIIIIII